MNPVKLLKPGTRLICLRDLSNKRQRRSTPSVDEKLRPEAAKEDDDDDDEEGGEEADGEMKPGCLPVVSKSPVPAITPVGSRPLSLTVVTSTDGQVSRSTKSEFESRPEASSRSSSGKAASTPSPASLQQMAAAAEETTSSGQDSPTSPTKQLSKLKRFLKTIHHLGSDISPEIGELVRNLVLALVNNKISIEEFHEKLHRATNFPLRPFVIPFLKSSLPILQQELQDQAELCRLSPHQFLAKNEHLLFHKDDRTASSISPSAASGGNEPLGKRRHPDRKHGANYCLDSHQEDSSPAPKRPRARSSPLLADHPSDAGGYVRMESFPFGLGLAGSRPILLQDVSAARLLADQLDRDRIQRDRERYFSNYNCHTRTNYHPDPFDRGDDEWKHVEHLLQCIMGMVDKCQRALLVLQERSVRNREDLTTRIRRTVDGLAGQLDIKRYVTDLLSHHDYQPTEEQRIEAYRRAEESVKDFRRQTVVELQKAVAASETKAREMLAVDRMKMEQTLEEVRRKTRDEVTHLLSKQEDSDENCWNCGRIASQTCSGCNIARYCGAFCQHRHWESHHRVCGKAPIAGAPTSSSASSSFSSSSAAVARLARHSSDDGGADICSPSGNDPGASAHGALALNGETSIRSRSRTKSVSPVLLQAAIKQEKIN